MVITGGDVESVEGFAVDQVEEEDRVLDLDVALSHHMGPRGFTLVDRVIAGDIGPITDVDMEGMYAVAETAIGVNIAVDIGTEIDPLSPWSRFL